MKRILYTICLFIISLSAFAQIPKGTTTVGGLVSFSHQKDTDPPAFNNTYTTTTNMAVIRPGYGLFVVNNLCVGADISLLLTSVTNKSSRTSAEAKSKSRGITVGPFVRYYLPTSEKLYAVFGAGYSWGQSKSESNITEDGISYSSTSTYKTGSSVFDLSAGLAFFLNPNAALEGTINYTNARGKDRDDDTRTVKTQQFGLGIGLRIFLRKSQP